MFALVERRCPLPELLERFHRLAVSPQALQGSRVFQHCVERIGVVRTEYGVPDLHRTTDEGLRLVVLLP